MIDTVTAASLVVVALYAVVVAWQRSAIADDANVKPGRWPGVITQETTRSAQHWHTAHRASARVHNLLAKALGIEVALTCLCWLQRGADLHHGIFITLSATAIAGFTIAQQQAVEAAARLDADHAAIIDLPSGARTLRSQ